MRKYEIYDEIYKIVSILNFLIHLLLCIFVVIVSFLPFRKSSNFYEAFTSFFGKTLGTLQPYLVLSLLILSCVGTFLAIKRPAFSIWLCFSFAFFLIMVLPYSIEAMVFALSSPWIDGPSIDSLTSSYGIGYTLMGYASHVGYLDLAFILYSFVTLFVRNTREYARYQIDASK